MIILKLILFIVLLQLVASIILGIVFKITKRGTFLEGLKKGYIKENKIDI